MKYRICPSPNIPWHVINKIPGWLHMDEAKWLFNISKSMPGSCVIVEVGSFCGRSSVAIASGLPVNGWLHCVEPFTFHPPNDEISIEFNKLISSGLSQQDYFIKVTSGYNVIIHKDKSPGVAKSFANDSVDMVFIDANHGKIEVWNDLSAWWPKIKRNGIMCGHDFSPWWMGVKRSVMKFTKLNRLEYRIVAGSIWVINKT